MEFISSLYSFSEKLGSDLLNVNCIFTATVSEYLVPANQTIRATLYFSLILQYPKIEFITVTANLFSFNLKSHPR